MREIKFRAWTGSMMEYRVVVGELGAFYVPGLDPKDTASMSPFNTIYSKQTHVMQFTGLKDKNGKEIYEGDIIQSYGRSSQEIYWKDCRWHLKGDDQQYNNFAMPGDLQFSEVIGNIYEYPHLLTNEK